jgi:23S rRNA (guanosine2251-2'-O)-methyltransferase
MERVVGFHPVREALRAGRRRLVRLLVREGLRRPERAELLELAGAAGVPVVAVSPEELSRQQKPGERAQGLVLEAGPIPLSDLDQLLLEGRQPGRDRCLVVLDGVEDPQNLGAVARVADASGAAGLVVAARRCPPLSPAVSRASAGAIEHLPVYRVTNLRRELGRLREAGFWVIGSDADAGENLFDTKDKVWQGDLALVFGAEGRGIRVGLAPLLDHRVRIPLRGKVGSLNVATAAAVVLFEVARRVAPLGEPARD